VPKAGQVKSATGRVIDSAVEVAFAIPDSGDPRALLVERHTLEQVFNLLIHRDERPLSG
jgi:hypothetical protein